MEVLLELFKNPAVIDGVVDTYKPTIYHVMGKLFECYKDFVDNYDYYQTTARGNWNRYKALLEVGFTEDQAMAIMIAELKSFRENMMKSSGIQMKAKA